METHTHTLSEYILFHSGEQPQDTTTAAAADTATPTSDQQENGTETTAQQEATPTPGQEGAEAPQQEPEKAKKEKGKGKEKKPEAKKKPTVKHIDLAIAERTASLTKKQMDDMREKEVCVPLPLSCLLPSPFSFPLSLSLIPTSLQVNMAYQDQLEQQKVDAKNAVEEYVYGMRDKVSRLHHTLCTLSMSNIFYYIIS